MTPISLSQAHAGDTVMFNQVNGGKGARLHLAEMGLNGKIPIKILKNSGSGPLLIGFRNTRVMIGRKLSQKIQVLSH